MDNQELAAKKFYNLLEELADVYVMTLKSGTSEESAFNITRDAIFKFTNDLTKAANMARVVIAIAAKKYGNYNQYQKEDMKTILNLAF
jgi:hypothetical protein